MGQLWHASIIAQHTPHERNCCITNNRWCVVGCRVRAPSKLWTKGEMIHTKVWENRDCWMLCVSNYLLPLMCASMDQCSRNGGGDYCHRREKRKHWLLDMCSTVFFFVSAKASISTVPMMFVVCFVGICCWDNSWSKKRICAQHGVNDVIYWRTIYDISMYVLCGLLTQGCILWELRAKTYTPLYIYGTYVLFENLTKTAVTCFSLIRSVHFKDKIKWWKKYCNRASLVLLHCHTIFFP